MPTSPFATPRLAPTSESPTKQQLIGELVIVRLRKFEADMPSAYGTTAAAFLDELVVVTGEHAGRYDDVAFFGLLGKQIGEALEVGDLAPGRIVSGTTKKNAQWVGIDFAVDEKDQALALAAWEKHAPAKF